MSKPLVAIRNGLIAAALLAGGYFVYTNHNELLDRYYLRNYVPSQQIANLAAQSTMTDEARRLFYRADPQIDSSRDELVQHCQIKSDKTIELGCYLSNDKIYLLNIQQPELRDEMIVTAAHEALHAAYDRMSKREKREINAELQQVAAGITDKSLKQRLADYARLEPGEQDNELHSILGTEYASLTPTLEEHYAIYFSNRKQLVAYSDKFNQRFDGLHQEIEQLDAQIKATKARMQTYLDSGNVSTYNTMVPIVNAQINRYNQKVTQYNQYASDLLGKEQAAGSQ